MKAWRLWPKPCRFAAANVFGGEAFGREMPRVDGDGGWILFGEVE